MRSFFNLWLVLTLVWLIAVTAIGYFSNGTISRSAASWAVIPVAALAQAAMLRFTRSRPGKTSQDEAPH